MTQQRWKLFVSCKVTTDVQVLTLCAEKFWRTKNPKSQWCLKVGEGDVGDRAAFASAPWMRPSTDTLSSFQRTSSTLAQTYFLWIVPPLIFLIWGREGWVWQRNWDGMNELSRTVSVPEFLYLCNLEEGPIIIWQWQGSWGDGLLSALESHVSVNFGTQAILENAGWPSLVPRF